MQEPNPTQPHDSTNTQLRPHSLVCMGCMSQRTRRSRQNRTQPHKLTGLHARRQAGARARAQVGGGGGSMSRRCPPPAPAPERWGRGTWGRKGARDTAVRQAACRPCSVRQIGHTPLPSAVPGFQARILLQQRPPSPTMSLASNARATAARTAHIRRSFE